MYVTAGGHVRTRGVTAGATRPRGRQLWAGVYSRSLKLEKMFRGGWPENWEKLDNSRTMVKPLSTKKVLNVGWPENWQFFFLEVYY